MKTKRITNDVTGHLPKTRLRKKTVEHTFGVMVAKPAPEIPDHMGLVRVVLEEIDEHGVVTAYPVSVIVDYAQDNVEPLAKAAFDEALKLRDERIGRDVAQDLKSEAAHRLCTEERETPR